MGLLSPWNGQAEEFDRLARSCDRAAAELDRAIERLDRATRPSSGWTGTGAQSFRQAVEEQIGKASSAHASMRAAASAFRRDADQVRKTLADLAEQARKKAENAAKSLTGRR